MSVIHQRASSLGRRAEVPNQELARQLAKTNDREGIAEIAANLWSKDKTIQADCLKVLYEIGYLKPELVAPYAAEYLKLLKNRSNRLVWGGMIAIATISRVVPETLFPHIASIQQAMDSGSVITRDAGVWALSDIAAANADYRAAIFPYLLNHLSTCRPKDVPQHTERIVVAVGAEQQADFLQVVEKRMKNLSAAQQKRLRRVIQQTGSKDN